MTIVGDDLNLIVHNRESKKNTTIQKKVGRSLHRIPDSELVSYINKKNEQWEIWSLHPKSGETKKIIDAIDKKEDICWLPDGTILAANKNTIYKYNPSKDSKWLLFHAFDKTKIKNISRILVNKKGTRLALVSE